MLWLYQRHALEAFRASVGDGRGPLDILDYDGYIKKYS